MLAEKNGVQTEELTERIRKLLKLCTPEELELVVLFLERYLTGRF